MDSCHPPMESFLRISIRVHSNFLLLFDFASKFFRKVGNDIHSDFLIKIKFFFFECCQLCLTRNFLTDSLKNKQNNL